MNLTDVLDEEGKSTPAAADEGPDGVEMHFRAFKRALETGNKAKFMQSLRYLMDECQGMGEGMEEDEEGPTEGVAILAAPRG